MITLSHIKKNFGLESVLEDFSMVLYPGERVGLIGANGSGKSTIFKLITGIEVPDQGTIAIGRNVRIGYLTQIPKRNQDETVMERLWKGAAHLKKMEVRMRELEGHMTQANQCTEADINRYMEEYGQLSAEFEEQGGYIYESRMKQITQGLGFTISFKTKITHLSGGEMARLELAVLLLSEPEIMLLDEPTNHLDLSAIDWLEGYLNKFNGIALIISHDRYFLDKTVKRIIEIKDGGEEEYPGNYSYYLEERKLRYELALKKYENQQKVIRHKEEAAKRIRNWARIGDNEKLHKQAANIEKQIEKIEKLDRPTMDELKFQLQFEGGRSGKEVLVMEGVQKSFDQKTLLKSTDLKFFYGQRLGLIGPNGSGKTTLLKLMLGENKPNHGGIKVGANVKIGYLDQHQKFEDGELTLLESLRNTVGPMPESKVRGILAHYGFVGEEVFKLVKDLSGGERSRFIMLKMVHSQVNFLILDEPTNHLDLPSIEIFEESLKNFDGTLLVVSHDRYFLNRVVDEIYAIEDQQLVYYPGNYDKYQQKLLKKAEIKKQKMLAKTAIKSEQKKHNHSQFQRAQEKEQKMIQKQLQREVESLEEEIATLETKIEENQRLMIIPENLGKLEYLNKLNQDNQVMEGKIKELMLKWEEAASLLG
ncbi:MAG: ABC-F family ATP-binding cassette domain-containing protein [Halanaerobiales bacterium]|nr:ABC-F family ATP-binding cassette domain-containing protein [Halanaerobiales bacterium]